MIKRNMNGNNTEKAPLFLTPVLKNYLWGGTRLSAEYGKGKNAERIAESWECSTHPHGESIIRSGSYAGRTLRSVLKEHPEMIGTRQAELCKEGELPVLVKILDAGENASIQVHPDDVYALVNENGSLGKTEMWYVLDAEKGAELVYGFAHDMDAERLKKSLADGSVEKYLQSVPVKKDDVFFIPPGCVHSVGAGILLVEIQENSDLTYRIYDFGRVDQGGQERKLHVEKALEVLNYQSSAEPRQPMRVLRYEPGCATEFLCRCKYFQVERKLISAGDFGSSVCFVPDEESFQILLCVSGDGYLQLQETGVRMEINAGDCVFVPAAGAAFRIGGMLTILQIRC